MKHIFLYGPPGVGKSTAGRILADRLELEFLDLDVHIEQSQSSSIAQIMASHGEGGFRELESLALERTVLWKPAVIALGGGALLRAENRGRAESNGDVVCLSASETALSERLGADGDGRPLLAGEAGEKLAALLAARASHYASFELRVQTDGLGPEQVAWRIQQALGRFRARGMGAGYDVIVRPGGLQAVADFAPDGTAALVSDDNVGPRYAPRLAAALREAGCAAQLITIPAGETAKTLETVAMLWNGFLEAGLDRQGTVLALGGGVVGDLAGFAASTYMRGIPWIGLPTSLLAMVDASLGGKTGFDLPHGKNLIGSFHPPSLVIVDPATLDTLPMAELRSGLAEVVKHGVIADPGLFDLCAAGIEAVKSQLPEIIRRAIAVKLQIVEADPYERGPRAALNFGHTVGHAVEKASGYSLRHGEAVAIGMVCEAGLAERLGLAEKGLADQIGRALQGLGLPTAIPAQMSRAEILSVMQVDKKSRAGQVRFALPESLGRVRTGITLQDLNEIFAEAV